MVEITETGPQPPEQALAYHILRYVPNLVRDEWVNIGVLVFNPETGERRLRLIEEQDEYSRVRRLHPWADEALLRALRDDLENRLDSGGRTIGSHGSEIPWQKVLSKWDETLSNALQIAPQKGVLADDLDAEVERLYADHVAVPRKVARPGFSGGRAGIRSYCAQVFRQARIWDRLEKSVRVAEFTFQGDPARLDYSYRRNGTRGFVHTLSVTRAPQDAKSLAYNVKHIAEKARYHTEFAAVTDVALSLENDRHRFVLETLREVGVEPVPMEGLAVWVAKLRPGLRQ
ncbi:MAG TPA: DUF3037 domain-containing protein [Candidatus Acidoferrum sp.]|nr:DUF3037 domain-containing protein [Candidatus Acidoferrum sp.]